MAACTQHGAAPRFHAPRGGLELAPAEPGAGARDAGAGPRLPRRPAARPWRRWRSWTSAPRTSGWNSCETTRWPWASATADGDLRYVLLQPVREFVIERTDARRGRSDAQPLAPLADRLRPSAARHAATRPSPRSRPNCPRCTPPSWARWPMAPKRRCRPWRSRWPCAAIGRVDTRAGLPLAVMQALDSALPAVADARPALRGLRLAVLFQGTGRFHR